MINVVQGLVVDDEGFVRVLEQLVGREDGVVRLDDGVGDLGGRIDRVGARNSIRICITNFEQQKGSHPRSGSSKA